ncbi:FecR domain-containing protein [Pseudomonas sp. NPDC007930]|uniref:FecR family protein n=1 Tax=Pseudomonas sp. NPDC007930 TaxID=3364417 RepID=UPI0036EA2D3F
MNSATDNALAERQAIQWLAVLAGQPSQAQLCAFERWLAQGPAHAQAWEDASQAWAHSEVPARRLADEDAQALGALLAAMDAPARRPRRRWAAALASAACVLALLGSAAGWRPDHWLQDLGADHVCPPGPVCSTTLAEGSRLTLDAGSAIAVDFAHGSRQVQVRRGAVFFQVAHTGQPFRVHAGSGEVQVMGTEFEVRREAGGERVTVLSGRVSVRAAPGQPEQILGADQQVAYRDGQATAVGKVDSAAWLAWRDGWLNYYQAPFAQVVSDLAVHYPGRILLLGDGLGQRTLSGSFPSQNPQAVIDSLQKVLGFEQSRFMGLIVLR